MPARSFRRSSIAGFSTTFWAGWRLYVQKGSYADSYPNLNHLHRGSPAPFCRSGFRAVYAIQTRSRIWDAGRLIVPYGGKAAPSESPTIRPEERMPPNAGAFLFRCSWEGLISTGIRRAQRAAVVGGAGSATSWIAGTWSEYGDESVKTSYHFPIQENQLIIYL